MSETYFEPNFKDEQLTSYKITKVKNIVIQGKDGKSGRITKTKEVNWNDDMGDKCEMMKKFLSTPNKIFVNGKFCRCWEKVSNELKNCGVDPGGRIRYTWS